MTASRRIQSAFNWVLGALALCVPALAAPNRHAAPEVTVEMVAEALGEVVVPGVEPGVFVLPEDALAPAEAPIIYRVRSVHVGLFDSMQPSALVLFESERRSEGPEISCRYFFIEPTAEDGSLAWENLGVASDVDPWLCAEADGVSRDAESGRDRLKLHACVDGPAEGAGRWDALAGIVNGKIVVTDITKSSSGDCTAASRMLHATSSGTVVSATRQLSEHELAIAVANKDLRAVIAQSESTEWDDEAQVPVVMAGSLERIEGLRAELQNRHVAYEERTRHDIDLRSGAELAQTTSFYLTGFRGLVTDAAFSRIKSP